VKDPASPVRGITALSSTSAQTKTLADQMHTPGGEPNIPGTVLVRNWLDAPSPTLI
jgi:hypothetical protein